MIPSPSLHFVARLLGLGVVSDLMPMVNGENTERMDTDDANSS